MTDSEILDDWKRFLLAAQTEEYTVMVLVHMEPNLRRKVLDRMKIKTLDELFDFVKEKK